MRESLRVLAATAALSITAWSGPAPADVAPPDSCPTGSIGQTCSNAGPNNDAPGVCVASTCSRPTPDGSAAYACAVCQTAEAGAPPQDAAAAEGGSSGGSSSGGSGSGKSSCTMSPLARDGATGFGMLALGVGALAIARRRRP